ncbi:MAG: type IV pilus modification protein PilV [Burkholderiaceae bacterium]|nr:type IV pilus modification protein PilV [Burkholderiaceae bacterium]
MNGGFQSIRTISRGFTLLELMVSIVVLSVGLLGLGLLMASSVRSNHVGLLHTQATFAAETVLDRMRANVVAIWNDDYDATVNAATVAPAVACDSATPCTPAEVADRDLFAWGQLLGQLLPNGEGTVACAPRVGATVPTASQLRTVPIYDGLCTITVTWDENTETADGVVAQNFQWIVQP